MTHGSKPCLGVPFFPSFLFTNLKGVMFNKFAAVTAIFYSTVCLVSASLTTAMCLGIEVPSSNLFLRSFHSSVIFCVL